jgi:hypothetical protein
MESGRRRCSAVSGDAVGSAFLDMLVSPEDVVVSRLPMPVHRPPDMDAL